MSTFTINSHLVGKTIKDLRLSRHWTQDYLADIVGYSVRNLRRIENDGTTSIDIVNAFADIFEVSAIDILSGDVSFLLKKGYFFCSAFNSLFTWGRPTRCSLISLTLSKTILGASILVTTSLVKPKKYGISFQCCLFLFNQIFV